MLQDNNPQTVDNGLVPVNEQEEEPFPVPWRAALRNTINIVQNMNVVDGNDLQSLLKFITMWRETTYLLIARI